MYVTLITAQDPLLKLICERTTSYRGSAPFHCTATDSAMSTLDYRDRHQAHSAGHPESLTVFQVAVASRSSQVLNLPPGFRHNCFSSVVAGCAGRS